MYNGPAEKPTEGAGMKLQEDVSIQRIALDVGACDGLLETERELEDRYPVYGGYSYIGQRGDVMFWFSCNLMQGTVGEIKRLGRLDHVYLYDIVERAKHGSK